MGIDTMVFARMSNDLIKEWESKKLLQFLWKPTFLTHIDSNSFPGVLTHKLISHYSSPADFLLFNGGDLMSFE